MLQSAQTTINGSASVRVSEEDVGGHKSVADRILFITESLTLSCMRAGDLGRSRLTKATRPV